ncbi:polymorphic toxin-type HINT domain-containing protein [Moraxella catarrhalis]
MHTIHGLKPIETIEHGDLIWSRQEFGTEYGYRPVIATKVTPNQEIYEVVVKHSNNSTETFKTTKEHPFWVEGIGWLKASLLEQGMILLDRNNQEVEVISQYLLPNHPKLSITLKYKTSTPTILANMGCGCIMMGVVG